MKNVPAISNSSGISSHTEIPFSEQVYNMATAVQVDTQENITLRLRNHDKQNSVDFKWFIVRTLPHQEEKLARMLRLCQDSTKNILEVYCPTHTTVSVVKDGKDVKAPLFAGYVFVLSTQQALVDFVNRYYPEGAVLYERKREKGKKASLWTIPENQMRAFMDFNDNYADKVIILEKPFTDYAFNPKTNEPNEIVKVVDGPLKGCEGYLTRFRRDKRLVFNMKSFGSDKYYTVSIPNVWNLHVVRLHNAESDRQSVGTLKERAVDLLIGIIQSCGYGVRTLPLLYEIIDYLKVTPTLVGLCQHLFKQGEVELSKRIAQLETKDAELIINLIRYEKDNTGYVKANWQKLIIRPFLTPTSGTKIEDGKVEAYVSHRDFTEIISKVRITEQAYYPSCDKEETLTTTYFAHIGLIQNKDNSFTLFANWDKFLSEYFQTAGKANERLVKGTVKKVSDDDESNEKQTKLIESFRNYSPTLYNVLTDARSNIKALHNFIVGNDSLNVFAITLKDNDSEVIDKARMELTDTCVRICKEINSTVHLAVWRRYLRPVWLHE